MGTVATTAGDAEEGYSGEGDWAEPCSTAVAAGDVGRGDPWRGKSSSMILVLVSPPVGVTATVEEEVEEES